MELIRGQSTLTLATAADSGPWSAPVCYVFLKESFHFFSSPDSRHIREALTSKNVAASLYHQADAWQELRGLQMTGEIHIVRSPSVSVKAVSAYLKHFDFVHTFFSGKSPPTAADFFSRFKVRLYAFTPTAVYLVDNRAGFGNRQHVVLMGSG